MTDLFHTHCPNCGQSMPDGSNSPFDAFWQDVPHKIGKEAARRAWRKLASADRQAAHGTVKSWYAWFAKTYPTASPVHPATYINGRRWEDQGTVKRTDVPLAETFAVQAIRSGKPFLCTQITDVTARELVAAGLVTPDQCKAVGIRV